MQPCSSAPRNSPLAPPHTHALLQRSKSIKLYVKRVFISDEFDDDLMPRYLSFIKVWGVGGRLCSVWQVSSLTTPR